MEAVTGAWFGLAIGSLGCSANSETDFRSLNYFRLDSNQAMTRR